MCCTQALPAWYIEIWSRWTTWCQWMVTWSSWLTLACQRSHQRRASQLSQENVFPSSSSSSSSHLLPFYPFFLNVLKLMLVCLALGTIRWGAPETFDYPALWTDKADIYSLGMTFWEIASRKVPFEDVSEPRCPILFPILFSFLLSLL